ncbi:ROK family protein [Amycolatopsis minnesotensis]|uniref:ROK family protein n=1 Tax=Amycolatopsis minnesotensis TaxID=337894 RepID=A0ABN2Q673_9PSEU
MTGVASGKVAHRPGGGALLGVDIGGTKVALRVEDGDRVLEKTFRWQEGDGSQADLDRLTAAIADLRAGTPAPLTAMGVALPATVSGGVVAAWPSRPGWAGLEIRERLRAMVGGAPVAIADDGDLAALAESRAASCDDLVYVGVGTGIGGGIVLDGRPCPGPGRGSCELGHVVVALDGPRCTCGRRGCVQAIASGPAILAAAGRARGSPVSGPDLAAAGMGAHWARSPVERASAALAAALVGVGELVRPSLVVVGGGFAAAVPGFTDEVARHCAALARPGHVPAPVRPALLGGLSSLHGAVHAAAFARDGARSVRDDVQQRTGGEPVAP